MKNVKYLIISASLALSAVRMIFKALSLVFNKKRAGLLLLFAAICAGMTGAAYYRLYNEKLKEEDARLDSDISLSKIKK